MSFLEFQCEVAFELRSKIIGQALAKRSYKHKIEPMELQRIIQSAGGNSMDQNIVLCVTPSQEKTMFRHGSRPTQKKGKPFDLEISAKQAKAILDRTNEVARARRTETTYLEMLHRANQQRQ